MVITAFLSNDATAVVLTPAVAAIVKRVQVDPWPHVLACAMIANAASFLLPIANPANLVMYGTSAPRLDEWLHIFLLPSLAAIAVTYGCIWICTRTSLAGSYRLDVQRTRLDRAGSIAVLALAVLAGVLLVASQRGYPLGWSTLATAVVLVCVATSGRPTRIWPLLKAVSWEVILLVGALFVLFAGLEQIGIVPKVVAVLEQLETAAQIQSLSLLAGAITLACAVANNLPVSLFARHVFQALDTSLSPGAGTVMRHAAMIVIDMGPNVAVSSSLATLLWMDILKKENIPIDPWKFFRVGLVVTALALPAALFFLKA